MYFNVFDKFKDGFDVNFCRFEELFLEFFFFVFVVEIVFGDEEFFSKSKIVGVYF